MPVCTVASGSLTATIIYCIIYFQLLTYFINIFKYIPWDKEDETCIESVGPLYIPFTGIAVF